MKTAEQVRYIIRTEALRLEKQAAQKVPQGSGESRSLKTAAAGLRAVANLTDAQVLRFASILMEA